MKPFRTRSVQYCFSPTVTHLWLVLISQLPVLARYTSYIIVCTAIIFILHQGLRDRLSWVTDMTGLDKATGQDFFFFVSTVLLSTIILVFLLSSAVSLSYFNLAVSMRKCLGKHSCMSSPFSIAILNGICSLWAPILFCGDVDAIQQNYKQTSD